MLKPPPAAPRTRLLLLHPRFRILNRSGIDLAYRSRGEHVGGILGAADRASSVPFHWGATPAAERFLQLALLGSGPESMGAGGGDEGGEDSDADGAWCGAFSIDVPTELVVSLRAAGGRRRLLQVSVEVVGPTLLVCLDVADAAPYRLVNDFDASVLLVTQQGTGTTHTVMPRGTIDYTWDECATALCHAPPLCHAPSLCRHRHGMLPCCNVALLHSRVDGFSR